MSNRATCILFPSLGGEGLGEGGDHIIIPKTKYRKSLSFKSDCSLFILNSTLEVLSAVEFNDGPLFQTNEVNDEVTYRFLTTEFHTKELS